MTTPLNDVRIVEVTSMLAGPWAASLLADQGADVVKIEVPGIGDHTRSVGENRGGLSVNFLNINRNKRSMTLNLKSEKGLSILYK